MPSLPLPVTTPPPRHDDDHHHDGVTSIKQKTLHPPISTLAPPASTPDEIANFPTLCPSPLADLVSALATAARLSLRITAFFVEAIMESSQYSTRMTLGYTRRVLISAISSARRVYLMGHSAIEGDFTGIIGVSNSKSTALDVPTTDAFLPVLEKYTNLGIYVIHHTFTMAELFTMSGFYLTSNAVQSAHWAAQESVALFDSIFGSNESSRALSSIITMVRREVLSDARFEAKDKGKVASLTALTRALTAFACLQSATWKRTAEKFRMKVLYDCTVVAEQDDSRQLRVKAYNNLENTHVPAIAGPGPSTMANRQASPVPAQAPTNDPGELWEVEMATLTPEEMLEITDEMSESTIITRLLELRDKTRSEEVKSPGETPSPDEDWVEVDAMLNDEIQQLQRTNNLDTPSADRLQLVLKTVINKLLSRKRIIRRVSDREKRFSDRADVRDIEWGPEDKMKRQPSNFTLPPRKRLPLKPFRRHSRSPSPEPRAVAAPPPPPPPPSPMATRSFQTLARGAHPGRLVESRQSASRTSSMQSVPTAENYDTLFPHDSLIKNIHRFMRYSSAAYGQSFLRIMGMGNSEYNFSTTARHHANSWAFAQHTQIPIDSLLLSSYTESSPSVTSSKCLPLVHYVAVDHRLKTVVLTCRGTLGLSDILIDLTCEYRPISIDGGDPNASYLVHSGMYRTALGLTARQSTVHQVISDALNQYPTYGLVVTGHSLGGGVAALLAIACATPSSRYLAEHPKPALEITTPFVTSAASGLPAGRPIHCYAYGPPAVTSPDLARYATGLITSVVQNTDVVPCLSLGVLRDLKNIAATIYEEGHIAEEIVARVTGVWRRKFGFQTTGNGNGNGNSGTPPPDLTDKEILDDWMFSLIRTLRADMDNDKLLPPGVVYIMEYFDVFITETSDDWTSATIRDQRVSHKAAHRVVLRQCDSVEERFREPVFSKTMLNDHFPSNYERSTQLLYDGLVGGIAL